MSLGGCLHLQNLWKQYPLLVAKTAVYPEIIWNIWSIIARWVRLRSLWFPEILWHFEFSSYNFSLKLPCLPLVCSVWGHSSCLVLGRESHHCATMDTNPFPAARRTSQVSSKSSASCKTFGGRLQGQMEGDKNQRREIPHCSLATCHHVMHWLMVGILFSLAKDAAAQHVQKFRLWHCELHWKHCCTATSTTAQVTALCLLEGNTRICPLLSCVLSMNFCCHKGRETLYTVTSVPVRHSHFAVARRTIAGKLALSF